MLVLLDALEFKKTRKNGYACQFVTLFAHAFTSVCMYRIVRICQLMGVRVCANKPSSVL